MTVKCLTEPVKNGIVEAFKEKSLTIDQMVSCTGRSRRTIIRVLEDAGIDPGIHRRPGRKSKKVLTEQTTMALDTEFMPLGDPIRTPKFNWGNRALKALLGAIKRPFQASSA